MSQFPGDLVKGIKCPNCACESVVYNGNYFCYDFDGCGWIMDPEEHPESAETKHIIKTYLTQRRDTTRDPETKALMTHYLEERELNERASG